MFHSQNDNIAAVVAVERQIAVRAKVDRPFPKLGDQIISHTTSLGVVRQKTDSLPDSLDRPRRGAGIFGLQKTVKPGDV